MKHKINKLVKLGHIARKRVAKLKVYEPCLGGGCGAASLHLMDLANANGLFPTFVEGTFSNKACIDFHCWLEYYGQVIDVTATQFGIKDYPKVYVTEIAEPYRPHHKTRSRKKATKWVNKWDTEAVKLVA